MPPHPAHARIPGDRSQPIDVFDGGAMEIVKQIIDLTSFPVAILVLGLVGMLLFLLRLLAASALARGL